jgi:hypothetical protein
LLPNHPRSFRASLLLVIAFAAGVRGDETAPKPVIVPFEVIQSKHITVMVKINGMGPYRVIFDTGAPLTLLSTKAGQAGGVIKSGRASSPFAMLAFGKQNKVKLLEVGTVKAKDVPVIVMDHPYLVLLSKVLVPVEGLVGFPFFARYRMTIDYQAKTLTLVPSGYNPPDFLQNLMKTFMDRKQPPAEILAPAGQWGFEASKDVKDRDAGVTVKRVLTGSAAAAGGLKPGDRLLSLDDRWTDSVEECFRAAGHVKPGIPAKAIVKRGDKELTLTITPAAGL